MGLRGIAVVALAALAAALFLALGADRADTSEAPPVQPGTREVLFVANNWDGTADIIDPKTFRKLGRFNTVPDLDERMMEIATNPVRLGYFIAIRQLIGEGNDQFADDMFSSHDGRYVYISRPSLADVVGIDLKTNAIVWRFPMEGQRSDHMAISPDGTRLLVSDSTARKVHVLNTADGKKVGEFPSGDSPHENNYSKDGKRIFHASIGLVYTPADRPVADSTKGDRWFQVVDAETNQVLKRLDIGKILDQHGFPEYSSAVRPMAISPDEKTVYMQLSFLHGFVEFDLENERPTRIATLPIAEKTKSIPREDYLLDSAHHGLAINPAGTKLCAAGTMSDYAAIVHTDTFKFTRHEVGPKPYWSTNSGDGRRCFVSVSGADQVVVLDYETEKELARIPVGDHPQRMRMGVIRSEYVGELPQAGAAPRRPAKLEVRSARIRGDRLEVRARLTSRATGRLTGTFRAAGRTTRFSAAIPAGKGRPVPITIRKRLTAAERRAGTGIVDLRYGGSDRVAADRVRIRAAVRPARLRVTRAAIGDSRLRVAGTVSRRARGAVRVRFDYVGEGSQVRTLRFRAPIRHGRWSVRGALPSQAARAGGQLSVQYTGDFRRRIRGEQVARRVRR